MVLRLLKCFPQFILAMNDVFSVFFLAMREMSLYLRDSSCSSVTISVAFYDGVYKESCCGSFSTILLHQAKPQDCLFGWGAVTLQLLFKINRLGMLSNLLFLSQALEKFIEVWLWFCSTLQWMLQQLESHTLFPSGCKFHSKECFITFQLQNYDATRHCSYRLKF